MKIKLFVSDMDGCAVTYPNEPFHSSWDALAEVLPEKKRQEWFALRDFYLKKGESFYSEWFEKQVLFLKGVSLQEAEKVLFPIPYSKGFVDFFQSINGQYKKGILSAGLGLVAERICRELSFDFFSANPLEVSNGFFTGKGTNQIDLVSKKSELEKISLSYGFGLENVCYFGDNFNDILVLKSVGLPIAFKPKGEEVASAAKECISDFREARKIIEKYNEH